MEHIAIESWVVMTGMSGLGLGLLVGAFKVLRRLFTPKRKTGQATEVRDARRPFENEIHLRAFRQQADKAFESISAVIDEEYQALCRLAGADHQPHQAGGRLWQASQQPSVTAQPTAPAEPSVTANPYTRLGEYLGRGLATDEIAQRLHLPHNEVELAVKLQAARQTG